MYILILLLVALGIVAAIIALCSKHGDDTIVEKATCSTCNGENQKCEQECMMEAATKPIEYYDDEELDTFIGRPADQYSDEEVEQFADVLYTMREDGAAVCTSEASTCRTSLRTRCMRLSVDKLMS